MRFLTPSRRLKAAHGVAALFNSTLPYFKGARQLMSFLTRLLAPEVALPFTLQTRYGFSIIVTTSTDEIDYNLLARGTYEAGCLHVIQSCLSERDVFLDIGANIGFMSLVASICVGSDGFVHALEPEPSTFKLLQENIGINALRNISTYNVGLGASNDILTLYANRHSNRGAASFSQHSQDATRLADVPVLTLDRFIADNEIPNIRMIKIDVEGWELDVIRGAAGLLSSRDAPILAVEYNTSFPSHRDIYNTVKSMNNYRCYVSPHGNWHASRLVSVGSPGELPRRGSPNLYFFLSYHFDTVPENLFA